jgi:hypothetical protein
MNALRVNRDGKRLTDLIFDQGRLISGVRGKEIPVWIVLVIIARIVKLDALAGSVVYREHRYDWSRHKRVRRPAGRRPIGGAPADVAQRPLPRIDAEEMHHFRSELTD